MASNKKLFFLSSIVLSIILFFSISINDASATASITSFLLNDSSQDATFNPNNSESVSIEVRANVPVKFTRLYICSKDQICNGTSGNYTRYFTQSDISDVITKSWNGKKSGDVEIVPAGEYKVMVSMTEGTNSPVTQFGDHSIFVDFSSASSTVASSTNDNDSETNATSTATTTTVVSKQSTPVIIRKVYVSSHSSSEDLSDYQEKIPFVASAGRERAASVGSRVEFNAKYDLQPSGQCSPLFSWSFGDGFDAAGKNITHIYKYPGEYNVVLNGTCGDYNSVSRTIIKVSTPNISITDLSNGDIEISNNSGVEVNIGSWKIKGLEKDFIFPRDTILGSQNKIVLSSEDLIRNPIVQRVSLSNHLSREMAYFDANSIGHLGSLNFSNNNIENTIPAKGPDISVAEAEVLAEQYRNVLAFSQKGESAAPAEEKTTQISANLSIKPENNTEDIVQTATVLASVGSSTEGFWHKLLLSPIKGAKSFVNMFYDFEK